MSDTQGHDQWHHHTAAEGVPQVEHGSHASSKALGLTFIAMVVGVIAIILILIVYFNTYVSAFKSQQLEGTVLMVPAYNAKLAAREHLGSHGWIDRQAGFVHIPVEDAMRKVIADYQNRSARAGARTPSYPSTRDKNPEGAGSTDAQG